MRRNATKSRVSLRLSAIASLALSVPLGIAACGSKLEQKECDRLRGEAFDALNKAQHCNSDAECKSSDFPEIGKPVSVKTYDELKKSEDAFKLGQCQEPQLPKRDILPIYCKQGLCVVREKAAPEPAVTGNAP